MGEGKAEVVVQSIASGVKKVQALRRVTPKAGWRGPVGRCSGCTGVTVPDCWVPILLYL